MNFLKPVFVLLFAMTINSSALFASETFSQGAYKIDDAGVEELFASSNDISFVSDVTSLVLPAQQKVKGGDQQMIAGIVALASWITGVGFLIPIHRLILGTGNEAGKIIALYCVTLGGCGIIVLIDGIILLLDSNGSQYVENPKFIMWH